MESYGDIPPPLGTETPLMYAWRLLRMWAVDSVEAEAAEHALGPRECNPDRVADDVVDVLAHVRQGQPHLPMIDCGHCWVERNGQPDRKGDWSVVICEECDAPWPCPWAQGGDTPGT